jgi:hypothetical protein
MTTQFVRRGTRLLAVASAVAALAACEDKRVQAIDTGMTRDQAITQLSKDARRSAGPDSMPNVFRRSEYLVDGKQYEVLYFTSGNEKPKIDSVEWKDLTPIVLVNNRVIGKGWDFWDSTAKALRITVPKRD